MPVVWVEGHVCFGSCRHGAMLREEWVAGAVPGILWALMADKPEYELCGWSSSGIRVLCSAAVVIIFVLSLLTPVAI